MHRITHKLLETVRWWRHIYAIERSGCVFLLLCLFSQPLFAENYDDYGKSLSPDSLEKASNAAHGDTVSEYAVPASSRFFAPNTYALRYYNGTVLSLDHYMKTWLHHKGTQSVVAEARWDTYRRLAKFGGEPYNAADAKEDWRAYAAEYNYPTFTLGLRFNYNHDVTMHRKAEDWGEKLEVDYTTHLGNFITLYGRFDRPLWHNNRWNLGYYLGGGVGYAFTFYDTDHHVDNELIGTRLNIFFTGGFYIDYLFSKNWGIETGLDFSHHSNGALDRPNKGANYLGSYVGLKYMPDNSGDVKSLRRSSYTRPWLERPLYLEFSLGVGGKALNEVWNYTQYNTEKDDPQFRTDKFSVYGAVSLQTDLMYRYARRWASGVGFDVFYGSYADRVRKEERKRDNPRKVSPWSVGLALKHETFFDRLSVRVGIGGYLYREMGTTARAIEMRYYERVGLFYKLSRATGLSAGFSVNAHKTKADFTELQISCPIRLKTFRR